MMNQPKKEKKIEKESEKRCVDEWDEEKWGEKLQSKYFYRKLQDKSEDKLDNDDTHVVRISLDDTILVFLPNFFFRLFFCCSFYI